ncbi:hypothetical protein PIB30_007305 [Stylosanthes scabra]|uniref:SAWADEE domain-containing protein n=1 Tax=Stylosanthes scabra TaxID=79078 RepID=A0ABU6X428_9FABA|nr:hypothetical protein [Stylosanthes scabra]
MDRLRPRRRSRPIFSGFTNSEIEKLERFVREAREQLLDKEFCHKISINFNRSAGRAGKPAVRWTEIQNWFEARLQDLPDDNDNEATIPKEPECKEVEVEMDCDRLSPRSRDIFSGFTDSEIEKLDRSLRETREQSLDKEFCHKIAVNFNRSADRAGKPAVRWTEIQNWFETKLQDLQEDRNNEAMIPKEPECKEGEIVRDLSELEFEAKSSKDGAWYDVETFLAHRFNSNGEAVSHYCCRFVQDKLLQNLIFD